MGGNGNASNNCLLVNFLGYFWKNGNSYKSLILLNFLFFFLKLLISSLEKGRFFNIFLILYFEAISSYIMCKKLFNKFKSSSNDFYIYLTIFMFMTWLFLIIDNYCSYCGYSHYLCKWLFVIILWLLIIICDYFMIIYFNLLV